MTWLQKRPAALPADHKCSTPSDKEVKDVEEGSMWECDACHVQWRVTLVEDAYRYRSYRTMLRVKYPPPPSEPSGSSTGWTDEVAS